MREALAATVARRECRLCTILGEPGLGKTRLARELIESLDGATALVGRCLPYGEGITYWPLRDMLRQVKGDPREWIVELADDASQGAQIADGVLGAVGLAATLPAKDETFWAVRKLFEALARRGPLVVLVDDVHWAEPTLLELLEHLLAFSSDAPILLLCLARPDFTEMRPALSTPRPNTTVIALAPFSDEEARALLDLLPGSGAVTEREADQVVRIAEGNPLFLEQLLAHQAEGGTSVPPGILALLSARIALLEPDERTVLERAAVEGRIFHLAGLRELLPPAIRDGLDSHLLALVRKELIHPSRAELPGEEAFRFRHILIRDAAYAGRAQADPRRAARAPRGLARAHHRRPCRCSMRRFSATTSSRPSGAGRSSVRSTSRPGSSPIAHAACSPRPAGGRPLGRTALRR